MRIWKSRNQFKSSDETVQNITSSHSEAKEGDRSIRSFSELQSLTDSQHLREPSSSPRGESDRDEADMAVEPHACVVAVLESCPQAAVSLLVSSHTRWTLQFGL
ncbi:hypothetical protein DPEC_G00207290 [Dallia pectoralis]|uniref:Uncharacterized protein n=1 Tax=Dallia pectoralis TaxID=75939 RepID=A0ACC2G561_DALPE|nr:hypothetical protein DPEC_G00207290 [Dallia pectoralis]